MQESKKIKLANISRITARILGSVFGILVFLFALVSVAD